MAKNKDSITSNNQSSLNQENKQVTVLGQYTFFGPLPPPQVLEQYNKIDASFAERILVMAEKQSTHRQELEKKGLEADIEYSNISAKIEVISAIIGLVFGFVISIVAIGGGILCVLKGHEISGGFISTGGVATLASVFVYGSKKKQNEKMKEND